MNIDFLGALNFAYIPFLIALFVPDFFSTFGTVLGVGAKAGYLDKDGNLPGIDKCFKVDAISTSLGALFGMPSMYRHIWNLLRVWKQVVRQDLQSSLPRFSLESLCSWHHWLL